MSSITNPTLTYGGKTVPLKDGLALAVGTAAVLACTLPGGKLQVSVNDGGGAGLRGVGYDDQPPEWAVPWTVTGEPGKRGTIVLEHRDQGRQLDKLAVTFTVASATPAPAPVPPPPATTPKKWPRFGACFFFSDGAGWVQRGQKLGVTHFRSFGESVPLGGAVPKEAFIKQRTILDACPGAVLVGCHGPSEDGGDVFTPADYGRFCAKYRPKLVGYESRYAWELPNEINLWQYLRIARDGNVVSADVVEWAVEVAKAARLNLGPDVTIVGPSIGWGDEKIHIAYAKALVEAGLLEHIDIFNDHLYPQRGLPQVVAQLGGVRQHIGPQFPFWLTENSWKYTPRALWAAQAPAMAKAVQDAGAVPFAYRLKPRGDSGMDDRALHSSAGVADQLVAGTWGLKA